MRRFVYLAVPFAGAIALSWATLVGLVLAVSWVESAGHLAGERGGSWAAFVLAALGSAQVAWQTLPVATLLGLVVATTQLARSGELLALLALGSSPRQLCLPYLVVASVMTSVGWTMAQRGLPPLARQHVHLLQATTGRLDAATRAFSRTEHWFRDGPRILYLPREDDEVATVHLRPQAFLLHDGQLACVTDAEALCWAGDGWQFASPTTLVLADELRDVAQQAAAPLQLPQALAATHGAPKQQRGGQLRRLIDRREAAGIDSTGHRLEARARWAYPTLCVLLVALVLPWALHPGRQRSLVAMLGAAAAVVATVFALTQAGRLAAASGLMGPQSGSWLAPALVVLCLPASLLAARRR